MTEGTSYYPHMNIRTPARTVSAEVIFLCWQQIIHQLILGRECSYVALEIPMNCHFSNPCLSSCLVKLVSPHCLPGVVHWQELPELSWRTQLSIHSTCMLSFPPSRCQQELANETNQSQDTFASPDKTQSNRLSPSCNK